MFIYQARGNNIEDQDSIKFTYSVLPRVRDDPSDHNGRGCSVDPSALET